MIRFYAYYSVGGYKELYLGDNKSTSEYTYFLPLLPVYKKRLEKSVDEDVELRKEVESLSNLPSIKEITSENRYGLPEESAPLFTQNGYAFIYRHLVGNKQVVAIRDIPSKDRDGLGREIPFLFCMVCEEKDDWKLMDSVATYFVKHFDEIYGINNKYGKLASLLHMDGDSNGLRFSLKECTQWLETIAGNYDNSLKFSSGKMITVHASENGVALLVKPNGMSNKYSLESQKLLTQNVDLIVERDAIRLDGEIHGIPQYYRAPKIDKKTWRKLYFTGGVLFLIILLLIIIF